MSKLADEVAQQRPLWEQSKQLEEVHRTEVAEVNRVYFAEAHVTRFPSISATRVAVAMGCYRCSSCIAGLGSASTAQQGR